MWVNYPVRPIVNDIEMQIYWNDEYRAHGARDGGGGVGEGLSDSC